MQLDGQVMLTVWQSHNSWGESDGREFYPTYGPHGWEMELLPPCFPQRRGQGCSMRVDKKSRASGEPPRGPSPKSPAGSEMRLEFE